MTIKIAINGFGASAVVYFRILSRSDDMEVVAINDLFHNEALVSIQIRHHYGNLSKRMFHMMKSTFTWATIKFHDQRTRPSESKMGRTWC